MSRLCLKEIWSAYAVLVEHVTQILSLLNWYGDRLKNMSPERMSVSVLLYDTMKLAEEKFSIITKDEWSSRYNSACQWEQNYLRLEPIIDDISEQIVVNLQNDSTSSCSSSEEGVEDEIAEDDNGELNGTEAL
jgi:hypothetical protein